MDTGPRAGAGRARPLKTPGTSGPRLGGVPHTNQAPTIAAEDADEYLLDFDAEEAAEAAQNSGQGSASAELTAQAPVNGGSEGERPAKIRRTLAAAPALGQGGHRFQLHANGTATPPLPAGQSAQGEARAQEVLELRRRIQELEQVSAANANSASAQLPGAAAAGAPQGLRPSASTSNLVPPSGAAGPAPARSCTPPIIDATPAAPTTAAPVAACAPARPVLPASRSNSASPLRARPLAAAGPKAASALGAGAPRTGAAAAALGTRVARPASSNGQQQVRVHQIVWATRSSVWMTGSPSGCQAYSCSMCTHLAGAGVHAACKDASIHAASSIHVCWALIPVCVHALFRPRRRLRPRPRHRRPRRLQPRRLHLHLRLQPRRLRPRRPRLRRLRPRRPRLRPRRLPQRPRRKLPLSSTRLRRRRRPSSSSLRRRRRRGRRLLYKRYKLQHPARQAHLLGRRALQRPGRAQRPLLALQHPHWPHSPLLLPLLLLLLLQMQPAVGQ